MSLTLVALLLIDLEPRRQRSADLKIKKETFPLIHFNKLTLIHVNNNNDNDNDNNNNNNNDFNNSSNNNFKITVLYFPVYKSTF